MAAFLGELLSKNATAIMGNEHKMVTRLSLGLFDTPCQAFDQS